MEKDGCIGGAEPVIDVVALRRCLVQMLEGSGNDDAQTLRNAINIVETTREYWPRPDIAAKLGPTIHSAVSKTVDYGAKVGVSVTFAQSGLRHTVLARDESEAIQMLREYIVAHPYGQNRHGIAWTPRPMRH